MQLPQLQYIYIIFFLFVCIDFCGTLTIAVNPLQSQIRITAARVVVFVAFLANSKTVRLYN